MKEEKRHLYRIDPAKVQQKIYDSYPSNSVVRRKIMEDAKQRELETISRTVNSFPFQLSETLLEQSIHEIKVRSFKFLGWFLLASGIFFGASLFLKTLFELVLVIIICSWCFGKAFGNLVVAIRQIASAKELSGSLTKLTNKLEEMKKKVI